MKKSITVAITLLALISCINSVKAQNRLRDTVKCRLLVSDTSNLPELGYDKGHVFYIVAYCVREQHDNTEGQIDPYIEHGFQKQYYWLYVEYLNSLKRPLSKKYLVWMQK